MTRCKYLSTTLLTAQPDCLSAKHCSMQHLYVSWSLLLAVSDWLQVQQYPFTFTLWTPQCTARHAYSTCHSHYHMCVLWCTTYVTHAMEQTVWCDPARINGLTTHWWLHTVCFLGQTSSGTLQTPSMQPIPGGHRLLHLPQCSRLVFRSCLL